MINRISDEVQRCLENECFTAALALALTLPDICGKAEYPCCREKARYLAWFRNYVEPGEIPGSPYGDDMPYPSAEMIYQLRCNLLHQGSLDTDSTRIDDERCKVDKFTLVITDEIDTGISTVSYGAEWKIVNRGITINIKRMCSVICKAAKTYYTDNKEKFSFFSYQIIDER